MRTTKKVVIELEAGEEVEIVARMQRHGLRYEARATVEHDADLGHPQLRIDITGSGQANVLNKHADEDEELDELYFNRGISVFI